MKQTFKNIFIAASILIGGNALAQSKSTAEEIVVDGFKVIYKPSSNQIVSARFFIKGGTANYSKDLEGIETLTLDISSTGGTSKYSKSELNRQLDKMGSSIGSASNFDFSNVSLNCIQKNFNQSWEIFEDVITSPLFDQEEFAKNKESQISNVKQGISDPDTYLGDMAMTDAFANLNYDKKINGSEESLTKISLDDIKAHYKKIINKKQCFLVVVGKVDRADLIEKVKKMVIGFPEGNFTPIKPTLLNISQSTMNTEDRKIATNYIRGVMNAPAYGTSEAYAMQLAFGILADRLFDEIRTKRSLSYAPGAFYVTNINPSTNIYVSTTDPKQSVQVMIDELKKIRKNGFSEKEITDQKSSYVTTYYMGLETNAAQTQGLGSAESKGNWKNYNSFIDNMSKVSPKEVNAVFNKYITGIRWSYLGDLSQISSEIFLQKIQ